MTNQGGQNLDPSFEERTYPQVSDQAVLDALRGLRATVIDIIETATSKEVAYVEN